eukprot:COSAG03_NODE_3779_length_1832_cov_1.622620_3_plen_136_part_00
MRDGRFTLLLSLESTNCSWRVPATSPGLAAGGVSSEWHQFPIRTFEKVEQKSAAYSSVFLNATKRFKALPAAVTSCSFVVGEASGSPGQQEERAPIQLAVFRPRGTGAAALGDAAATGHMSGDVAGRSCHTTDGG